MKVLVIDDEAGFAAALRDGLVAEGHAVDHAGNGVDGLWLARENPYDVIVLDLMLPGINGYEVCKSLRAEQNWTPVLILSAKNGEWDEVDGLDVGADDYLTKPFSYPVLLARLRGLARRRATPRPPVLIVQTSMGELQVDPAARKVLSGGAEIELTAREHVLLELLVRRAGTVLSKTDILQQVWDLHYEGDQNIVEVFIRRLRSKLGQDLIETVRGLGYRLVGETRDG
ncbi:response regulator transcription factor [Lentzea sp. NPDC058436]|uniref:response regulator transcription factor n=1 Tax=Lentzea sp. NPDC058436 TaxID=3346499 RepID=UPI00364BD349